MMGYTWNWGIFLTTSPENGATYLLVILQGLMWTVGAAAGAWVVALVMGSIVGVSRTSALKSVSFLAAAYVEVFRNIPILMQLFLWFFVVPELLPSSMGDWIKAAENGPLVTSILSIGLYMSARVAEQVRAGINALPRGQALAGQALGFTPAEVYRYVVIPQAYRLILPPLTSELLGTIKNTSIAMTIGLVELTSRAKAMQEYTFQVFEAYIAAMVCYLFLNGAATVGMRLLERKLRVPGTTVGDSNA